MEFFKKILKKKTNVTDVLFALENFSSDVVSFNNLSDKASEFFGNNWEFSLELYINTMPEVDKKKYLPFVKTALDFGKALSCWVAAQQVLNGAKISSGDVLKTIPEYEKYLPKFGIEGVRLLDRLKEYFNLLDDKNIPENEKDILEPENKKVIKEKVLEVEALPMKSKSIEELEAEETELKEVQKLQSENLKDKEEVTQILSGKDEIKDLDKVVNELKLPVQEDEKILKKVTEEDLDKRVFSKRMVKSKSDKSTSSAPVRSVVVDELETQNLEPNYGVENHIDLSETSEEGDWDIENFVRVHNFLSQSREVMSAISLYKKVVSLEEYPYYGFIIDTIDYLIFKGKGILSSRSDDDIKKYFPQGKSSMEEIILFYENQKQAEVVLPVGEKKDQAKTVKEYEAQDA